jgi:pectate lyase
MLGAITPAGLYTAPMSPATDTVTATSNADGAVSSSAQVIITAGSPKPSGPLPAFPGAQGGGAATAGGRGGQIIEVTNLNDSGSGSLRACVQTSGPRTCVFRVAGYITLNSRIDISNPFITIAGQSAPGQGITIRLVAGYQGDPAMGIDILTHDVIIRYIRVRPGAGGLTNAVRGRSAIAMEGDNYNVVVDHVSTSWSAYDNLGCWAFSGYSPIHNTTHQYVISAEGLSISPLYHSKGWNCGTDQSGWGDLMTDNDVHHSLFQSNVSRNPIMQIGRTRLVNNIAYNNNYGDAQFEGGVKADLIGNVFRQGPEYINNHHEMQTTPAYSSGQPQSNPSFYLRGNIGWNQADPNGDDWVMLASDCSTHYACETGQAPQSFKRSSPLPAEAFPITADPAATLAATLIPVIGAYQRLDCMGNWVPMRDAADQRLIDEFNNGTARNWPGTSSPSSENQVGGYPTLDPGTPCQESLHDGIPDQWKAAQGLSTLDTSLASSTAANGYTYLENYLNGTDPNLPTQ